MLITTQAVWAAPMPTLDILPAHETPGSFFQIDIPEDLASVEEVYEAPASLDPKVILHIQNVHGNYQAQAQVKKMLDYFYKNYGFKLIFCEGAAEKLDPKYLELFPEHTDNLALADEMAKKGQLTGPELYLMDAPKDVQAIGIEQTDLYRGNYEAFKQVYKAKKNTDSFLKLLDSRLELLSSRFLTRDMRRILSEWQKFHEGRREFMPFVKHLADESQKFLNLDLNSLFAQVEWPQTARLLVLQSMEADLKQDEAMVERDKLITFLKEHKASEMLISGLEKMEEKTISLQRLAAGKAEDPFQPRKLLERLAEEAAPMGFQFHQYPNFSLYAGYTILESEVDSKVLFQEIEKLFDRILESLTVSEKEKNLLELYKDLELLKKLVALELTRNEWDQVNYRKNWIKPQSLVERLDKMSASGFVTEELVVAKEVPGVFDAAFRFYDFARQREFAFYDAIEREMTGQKADRAILVTGGFHTDGLSDIFRSKQINYGILTPRMGGDFDKASYIQTLMETHSTMFDLAQMEMINEMARSEVRMQMGQNVMRGLEVLVDLYLNQFESVVDRTIDGRDVKSVAKLLQRANLALERVSGPGAGFFEVLDDTGVAGKEESSTLRFQLRLFNPQTGMAETVKTKSGKPRLFVIDPSFKEAGRQAIILNRDEQGMANPQYAPQQVAEPVSIESQDNSQQPSTVVIAGGVRAVSGRSGGAFTPVGFTAPVDLPRLSVPGSTAPVSEEHRAVSTNALNLTFLDGFFLGQEDSALTIDVLARTVSNLEVFQRILELQSKSSTVEGNGLMEVAEAVALRTEEYQKSDVLAAFKDVFEASSEPGAVTANLSGALTDAEYDDLADMLQVLLLDHPQQILQLLVSGDLTTDQINTMKLGVFKKVVEVSGPRFMIDSQTGFKVAEFSRMLVSLLVKMNFIKPAALSSLVGRHFAESYDGDREGMPDDAIPYFGTLVVGAEELPDNLTPEEARGFSKLRIAVAARLSRLNGEKLNEKLLTYLKALEEGSSYTLNKEALLLVRFMNDVFKELAIKTSA